MLLAALLALPSSLPNVAAQEGQAPKLQAILALTVDPGFEDEWFHTGSAHAPTIPSVKRVVRGQLFQVCVFTLGYSTAAKDHVDLRYDVKVLRPDGTSYFAEEGLELCVRDGLPAGNVQLAKEAMNISFDPPDPLGEYTIEVEVHDGIARASSSTNKKISLVEFPEPRPFKRADELGAWIEGYNASHEPWRVLDAIAAAGETKQLGGEVVNSVDRGFLRAVCKENKFLEPLLLERFPKLEHSARLAALDVLAGTEYDAKPFLTAATKEEHQAYEVLLEDAGHDPLTGDIVDAHQLDEIWGTFFATGHYAPIERMARALSLEEQAGGKPKHPEVLVLEGAARWSLKSNLRFPRVRAYCEWMLEHERLDAQDAIELKKLMEK